MAGQFLLGKLDSSLLRRDVLALRCVEQTVHRRGNVPHPAQNTRFVVPIWFVFRRYIEKATGIDDKVRGIHYAPLAYGITMLVVQALIVRTPGNNPTAQTGDSVVIQRATQSARCIDVAGDIVHGLRGHQESPILLSKPLRSRL
jgi:hypothetical protein